METTYEFIEKYLFNARGYEKGLRLERYDLNGSIIKIKYSYISEHDETYRIYDESIDVELLDYITFVVLNK